jgi:hypothetical protein
VKPERVAANSESRRTLAKRGRVPGMPTIAAWTIVALLAVMVVIGFGTLGGRANTGGGAGVVNPTHDARCPDLRIAQLDRCQGQRPLGPEDPPALL